MALDSNALHGFLREAAIAARHFELARERWEELHLRLQWLDSIGPRLEDLESRVSAAEQQLSESPEPPSSRKAERIANWRTRLDRFYRERSQLEYDEREASDELLRMDVMNYPLASARDDIASQLSSLIKNSGQVDSRSRDTAIIEAFERSRDALRRKIAKACKQASQKGASQVTDSGGVDGIKISEDGSSMRWGDELFEFTENQAAVVLLLYGQLLRGTPVVRDKTLCEASDRDIPPLRLDTVFRGNPAWGKAIRPGKYKGSRQLVPPFSPEENS